MILQAPGQIGKSYQSMIDSGEALRLQQRLAGLDPALWSANRAVQNSIDQRLGWLDCIGKMQVCTNEILDFAGRVKSMGIRRCVLLGMGGSSLAPEVFSRVFENNSANGLELAVLDTTSPQAIHDLSSRLDWDSTLFIVASKSGTTIESDSLFRYFNRQLAENGITRPGRQCMAITDSGTPLAKTAANENFLACFNNPSDIGGRFSVLSYFGLVPAALVGVDLDQLLESASREQASTAIHSREIACATRLGMIMGLAAAQGMDKLLVEISPEFYPFGAWLEQLVAESTGKKGRGLLPVIQKANPESSGLEASFCVNLAQPYLPVYRRELTDPCDLGAEFFRWEWATAIAGAILGINPFDEPNVAENKRVTLEVLKSAGSGSSQSVSAVDYAHTIPAPPPAACQPGLDDSLRPFASLIESATDEDYVAILAYCGDVSNMAAVFEEFQEALARDRNMVSTFGAGPGYLHSTGQLHKGGGNNGLFLLVTVEPALDLAIPGKPYSFAKLNSAQAEGDLQVLKASGRRILHIHLPDESPSTLAQFRHALTRVSHRDRDPG